MGLSKERVEGLVIGSLLKYVNVSDGVNENDLIITTPHVLADGRFLTARLFVDDGEFCLSVPMPEEVKVGVPGAEYADGWLTVRFVNLPAAMEFLPDMAMAVNRSIIHDLIEHA